MTAKMTAIFANVSARPQTLAEYPGLDSIYRGRLRTVMDARTAVFKTVCGCPWTFA